MLIFLLIFHTKSVLFVGVYNGHLPIFTRNSMQCRGSSTSLVASGEIKSGESMVLDLSLSFRCSVEERTNVLNHMVCL